MTQAQKPLLHKTHAPLTDLFPRTGDRVKHELSPEQVAFFRKNGYVKAGRVFDERQIGTLRESIEKVFRGENPRVDELYEIDADWKTNPSKNLFHILGMWLIDETFHDVLWHPALTVKASQLLETPRVRFWHDQFFYKPPRHPGVVSWHQDYSYWTRSYPARHVTANIVLDDATLENGCLHYVPGSHTWGLVPKLSLTKDMDAVKGLLTPDQLAAFKPEPMISKAGECTFHHSHTMHGSYGNKADIPRRSLVVNYMHPETRCSDGQNALLYGVPVIEMGAVIEGDYFPILIG